jgi:hypothetical protein
LIDVETQSVSTPSLALPYYMAPWDRPFFPGSTAVTDAISVRDLARAECELARFQSWRRNNNVRLVTCRLRQEWLFECGFLEAQNFCLIELNDQPICCSLAAFAADPAIATAGPLGGARA